jgi:hypothetical protein
MRRGGGVDISATRIGAEAGRLLRAHPGHAFCDECLAQRLAVGVREVRYALITLAGSAEFDQETWFCSACLQQKHVIHVAWLRFDVPYVADEATSDWRE